MKIRIQIHKNYLDPQPWYYRVKFENINKAGNPCQFRQIYSQIRLLILIEQHKIKTHEYNIQFLQRDTHFFSTLSFSEKLDRIQDPGKLPCPYPAATLLLPCCYPALILRLPSPYPAATLLLPCCYPALILRLPCPYPAATLLLPCPYPAATLLLPCCYPALILRLPCCYPAPILLLPCPYPAATLLLVFFLFSCGGDTEKDGHGGDGEEALPHRHTPNTRGQHATRRYILANLFQVMLFELKCQRRILTLPVVILNQLMGSYL